MENSCRCGHHISQHDMEADEKSKQCLQCTSLPCWNFNDQVREGESITKEQEPTETHQPKSSTTDTQPQLRELKTQQPVSDLDTEIGKIREEFRTHFTKCDELIKRLGNAIKKAGIVKESDICHEIKNILAEEIADKRITVRTIDRCCPDEWKHITKPKKKKGKMSFPKQQIAITQDGKSKTLQQEITPQGHSVEEKSASTHSAKQDIEKPVTSVSTPVEQESTAVNTQPQSQEPQVNSESEQVSQPQGPSHKIVILLRWDSLSEQMALAHSPGIEWVQLSGVLDERSMIVTSLRLERGDSSITPREESPELVV